MRYHTKRAYGEWFGLMAGILVFGFVIWGINFSLGSDDEALKIMLYIPTYLFLVVYVYLMIGAFNLSYAVTDDCFTIRWGVQRKKVVWDEVTEIVRIKGTTNLYPFLGASWPGYIIGLYSIKALGPVRMYGTKTDNGFLYLKTQKGFFGLTPEDDNLAEVIAQKTAKEVQIVNMDEIPIEEKGTNINKDRFYNLYHKLNIIFLTAFAMYVALFFPGSGAPRFIILLLVLAIALFFFNMANASRLFQFSPSGAYIMLLIGLAVTGIFLILAISEVSL
ncbi:MAG: PH domain-containing protein [Bacillota bacterium]|nr:PH domain-containing protein [Bacillota bacterium]